MLGFQIERLGKYRLSISVDGLHGPLIVAPGDTFTLDLDGEAKVEITWPKKDRLRMNVQRNASVEAHLKRGFLENESMIDTVENTNFLRRIPFQVVIDPGLPNEEICEIVRTGNHVGHGGTILYLLPKTQFRHDVGAVVRTIDPTEILEEAWNNLREKIIATKDPFPDS